MELKRKKPPPNSFYSKAFAIALLCLLGIIIYSNAFYSSFQFDDGSNIVQNRNIRDLSNLRLIWHIWPTRFITFLTFALNYHFGKLNVFGYHLFNLIIHIGASILVWWLIKLSLMTPVLKNEKLASSSDLLALFGAIIFLTHPIQTESVTYIYQRSASLTGFLYLFSFSLYVKSRLLQIDKNPISKWRILYSLSWLLGLISMFTKEHAATLPFAIILYEFCFLKIDKRIKLRYAIPFLFLFPIIPLLEFTVKPVTFIDVEILKEKPVAAGYYIMTQLRVFVTYIRLLFVPINQNLDYDYHISRSPFEMPTFFSFLFLLSILFIAFKTFKKYRLISFGIFWFYLTLVPESSIIPLGDLIFEHRLYLPSVGFCFILVNLAYFLLEKRSLKFVISILIIVTFTLSILTYKRNFVWKNQFTLWEDVVRKSPNKARALSNRGFAYYNKGDLDQAILDYTQAIRIKPKFAIPYNNRGVAYTQKGELDQAILDYNQALKINPDYAMVYYNRGNIYAKKGDYDQAIEDYNQAIKINPNLAGAYYNRGLAYYDIGTYDQAALDFDEAIRLEPNYHEAYYNRGNVYYKKGNYEQAISDFDKAIKLNPKEADPYYNRGNAYYKKGNYAQAILDFNQAIKLKPKLADAYYNRGNVYIKTGELDKAILDFDQAIKLSPDMADAYYNRGNAYYKKGNYDQATSDYNEAIKINPKYVEAYANRAIAYFSKREYEKSWEDVHKTEALGGKVHSEFLEQLKKASNRQR